MVIEDCHWSFWIVIVHFGLSLVISVITIVMLRNEASLLRKQYDAKATIRESNYTRKQLITDVLSGAIHTGRDASFLSIANAPKLQSV